MYNAEDETDQIKMVIAVRHDLQMTRGKEIAQACHACLGAILREHEYQFDEKNGELNHIKINGPTLRWLEGDFTKVCVKVNSEQELVELETKAKAAGINCCLIVDAGRTMFHGVPTPTCIALGPARSSKLDPITGALKLY